MIGLSGAGKTTVAPLVAARLGLEWIDLDAVVEKESDAAVAAIFRDRGEEAFRALEAAALARALDDRRPGLVIACGGGVLAVPESRAALRARAFVVWLQVDPETAAERIGAAGAARRPLVAGEDPATVLRAVLRARTAAYETAANAAVETEGRTPAEVADQVVALCRPDPTWP